MIRKTMTMLEGKDWFIVALVLFLCVGVLFGVYCLCGWIFMLLWNWLAVELLSAPALNYWVCVGIVFALKFLGNLIFPKPSSGNTKSKN